MLYEIALQIPDGLNLWKSLSRGVYIERIENYLKNQVLKLSV